MPVFRPTKIRPRTRRIAEEPQSVFDIAKGFNQVSELALDLEKLKIRYQQKIDDLSQTTDETRASVKTELETINNKFVRDALTLLDKSSIAVFAQQQTSIDEVLKQLNSKVKEAENAIARAVKIQKGDQGDPGKPGVSPSETSIVSKVLLKLKQPKVIHGKNVDEEALMNKLFKKIFKNPLEIEKIKGLEERLRNVASKVMLGGSGGGQGSWKIKALSGTMDSANKDFTYSGELPAENSERVFLNYSEQNPLTDYTLSASGGTVTVSYTVAPDASLNGLAHIIRFM